jgi:hypothetical protein
MKSRDADLKRSILDYLVRHPDAKDTQEGVLNWWIARAHSGDCDEQNLVKALEELVARDWIAKRDTSTQSIYSLNRARLEDIKRFLEQDRRAD